MHGGYVPYVVLGDETSVVHSYTDDLSQLKVYFEKPDEEFFFKYLELKLFDLDIIKKYGFTDEEVEKLLDFSKNNFDFIMEYARVGGVANAQHTL